MTTVFSPTGRPDVEHKLGGLWPKIEPLPGSLRAEFRRCGKPTCRCARGQLHGPYYCRRWWENGRQHKAYVRRSQLEDVRAALAAWRQLHPACWTLRRQLAELRALHVAVTHR